MTIRCDVRTDVAEGELGWAVLDTGDRDELSCDHPVRAVPARQCAGERNVVATKVRDLPRHDFERREHEADGWPASAFAWTRPATPREQASAYESGAESLTVVAASVGDGRGGLAVPDTRSGRSQRLVTVSSGPAVRTDEMDPGSTF